LTYGRGAKLRITCPTLEYVDISHEGDLGDGFGITLAQSCPKLQVLILEISKITDATLDALAAHCRDLHTFDAISYSITDAGLQRLTAACSLREFHLTCYDLQHVPVSHIHAILRNCPLLQSLSVNSPGALSEAWLLAVADNCPDLRDLDVDGFWLNETASGLLAVAQNCRSLQSLQLRLLRGDTGPAFCEAILHCSQLERFMLDDAVSDALLHALSHCPKLRVVDFANDCTPSMLHSVTAGSMIALAEGCRSLVELTLPDHAEVNIAAVRALSLCCPKLRTLRCVRLEEIDVNDREVAGLLRHCRWFGIGTRQAGFTMESDL
jgi:hypothetical protein